MSVNDPFTPDTPSPEHQSNIDAELAHRHSEMARQNAELAALYARRSGLAQPVGEIATAEEAEAEAETRPSPETIDNWLDERYKELSNTWGMYKIEIPAQPMIKEKMLRAWVIMDKLVADDERLKDRLGILLVPPTNIIGWPVKESLRFRQGLRKAPSITTKPLLQVNFKSQIKDILIPNMPKPMANKNWRVLVTDVTKAGLYFNSPNKIVKPQIDPETKEKIPESEAYMIGGYDTRALGPFEYAALSLQAGEPIDQTGWTWLLKGFDGDKLALRAGFDVVRKGRDRRFKFDLINPNYKWYGGHYRPTVEAVAA